ncbi:MAG: hypothetical protein EOO63_03185 [Hymenobacter sp.]|nr:MAG: hypothetical protein EOO63_03185 [Hymenobacter sp.]
MTRAYEQLYLRTLHQLVAAGVEFCVLGTFGLRQQCSQFPRHLVADCDLLLPADPTVLTTLVRQLQATGWVVALWEQPVALPLTAGLLAGKYYLRARQNGAVLDCAYENDYLSWAEFAAHRRWHNGLPLLSVEQILAQKVQCNRPADQLVLRWYRAFRSDQAVAASGASPRS